MPNRVVDLTGRRFGKLTVIRRGENHGHYLKWICQCDCGNVKESTGNHLKNGSVKSCGCYKDHYREQIAKRTKDMAGKTFGRLKVIDQYFTGRSGNAYWNCVCECGNKVIVAGRSLRSGHTVSCGCAQLDAVKTHGLSYHPLYKIWKGIIARCHDGSHPAYDLYGAKGIEVCQAWRDSMQNFIDDMGPRPKGTSIDRLDGTKGYSKDNCQWATMTQQQNNRTNNKWVVYEGMPFNHKQLCNYLGISYGATRQRIHRGKSLDEAFGVSVKSLTYTEAMKIKHQTILKAAEYKNGIAT